MHLKALLVPFISLIIFAEFIVAAQNSPAEEIGARQRRGFSWGAIGKEAAHGGLGAGVDEAFKEDADLNKVAEEAAKGAAKKGADRAIDEFFKEKEEEKKESEEE